MMRIDKLITELQKFPPDALAFAYEGEIIGLVVISGKKDERGASQELGYIPATEKNTDFDGAAVKRGQD